MTLHNISSPPPTPTSSDLALGLKLWTGRTKPRQTLYAINVVAQGYLPRQGYRRICAIHTYHPSLCSFVDSSLGFGISCDWTSSTEYASAISSIFPQTQFGPQFKHSKGADIVMGDIESLSIYPHYCKSCLVPNLLIRNIYRPAQLARGWTCQ